MDPSTVKFRRTKTNEWVLCGPAETIETAVAEGTKLTVARRNGHERHLIPLRAGSRFTEDGIVKCYGYTTARDAREDAAPEAAPQCPSCATPAPAAANFCPSCGQSISHTNTKHFQTEGVSR